MSTRSITRRYAHGGRVHEVSLRLEADPGSVAARVVGTIVVDDVASDVDVGVSRLSAHRLALEAGGRRVRATVLRDRETVWIALDGRTYELRIEERSRGGPHTAQDDHAVSPMTGGVTKVSVEAGAAVARGEALFVVEAMKMEYVVRASRDATIAAVRYAAGDQVEQGDVVVTFEEEA